jgi:hypothetical protein
MAKLGYVEPANISPALQGLGALVGDVRQDIQKQKGQALMQQAMQTRDPQLLAQLAGAYPELATQAEKWIEVQDLVEEGNLRQLWMVGNEALNLSTDKDVETTAGKRDLFNKRRNFIAQKYQDEKNGRQNPAVMKELEEAWKIEDPAEQEKAIKGVVDLYNSIGAGGGADAYKQMMMKEWESKLKMGDDWQKEQWGYAKNAVDRFEKMGGDIVSGYEMIQNLKPFMDKKRPMARGAINIGLTALAKMISPGQVTEKDLAAVAGGENPFFAFYDIIKRTLTSLDADAQEKALDTLEALKRLEKSWDPTNPETFDIVEFGNMIGQVAGANVPVAFGIWEGAENRAKLANMEDQYFNSYFSKENSIYKKLQGIQKEVGEAGKGGGAGGKGGTGGKGGNTSLEDELEQIESEL